MLLSFGHDSISQLLRFRSRNGLRGTALALSLLVASGFAVLNTTPTAYAQTSVTGALSGVVTDQSGAVVPGATVTVVDAATNAKQTVITNEEGRYTAGLLKPDQYKISAVASGLQSNTVQVSVVLGTTVPGDIQVTPTGNTTVVDVSADTVPLIDSQNSSMTTTYTEQQIQELPAPGGDITSVAFTAPGVVVNAGGSYGNFSSNGLPGISNLFVMNGFDNQDPFLNLNNSGSSNLSLGQGEQAEVTVVQNGYGSQYGRAAGAIIEYTTKSGSNQFHGEANYLYNGTALNANGWFNNHTDTPRPHAVSNEWAANVGGPIIKDKLFFFADYEGLRYVLPASGFVSLPSPQYEAYALANVPATAYSTYQQMFNLYNNSQAYKTATPTPGGGCGAFTAVSVCALSSYASATNENQEWLFTGRADWHISDKHTIYGRYKMDRGTQPTATSLINPLFDAMSAQPAYEGQFNDNYVITPNLTNSATIAANWYATTFGPTNIAASQAALPFYANFSIGADGSGTNFVPGFTNLGVPNYYPQGRNVTQYQLVDDISWVRGKHNFKFGANFRRDLVSDYDAQSNVDFPMLQIDSLGDIAQGTLGTNKSVYNGSNVYQQAFTTAPTAHLALYNLGVYAQDEWQATPKLKITVGARVDRTGPPACQNNCFSLYNGNFPNVAGSVTTPYGSLINPNNNQAFAVDKINFQPRVGFNYGLTPSTVIRGGIGLFADLYPAGFLDAPIQNFPNYDLQSLYAGTVAPGGAGSLPYYATAANTAIEQGFATGTVSSINTTLYNQGITFSPPSLNAVFPNGTLHEPQYLEYSLQVQHQFNAHDSVSLGYAGNYGYNELIQNPFLNASTGIYSSALTPSNTGTWLPVQGGTIAGLNTTPLDPSFGEVNSFTNNAHSNYNGGMVVYTHQGHGITAHLSYTYSHALDTISNGGVGEFYNIGSVTKQLTPTLGKGNLNYSNADYDIRNDLVGDIVYEEPFKMQNKIANYAVSGWVISGKTYYRSGEPFSVNNTNAILGYPTIASINNTEGLTSLMPQALTGSLTNTCGSNPYGAVNGTCLDFGQYAATQTTFGNVRRNAFFGPHYADTDMTLMKQFVKREGVAFQLGAQAYNVFNHANFSNPNATLGTGSFGTITSVQAPPTSPYGSFQSAAVTQRVLVVTGKITF
ncbi:TonB-dependent receptor [Acidicapsa acidisoli]|uniref:TonB-dependent receptor n=1 Tax=Acidicapsa acidisoli TaxID=1615681 RepID=UPI0021E01034|nr:carboxypeptidase regulatory-like domain-containing protein [Acidicapsa acidisoli]